ETAFWSCTGASWYTTSPMSDGNVSRRTSCCSSSISYAGPTGWMNPPRPCCVTGMSDDPTDGARSVRSSSGRFSVPVPVVLAEAISERYSLERELARGGMATVYLGQDHQKQQAVAIKVMHPKLATVLGAERFLREIRVAKAMDHPLIVPLVDSGN